MKGYNDKDWSEVYEMIIGKYSDIIPKKHEFKKWFFERENVGWCFDAMMMIRLYLIHIKKLQKEDDYVVVIVGKEGSGKSTLAHQLGLWVDPQRFSSKNIAFTAEQVLDVWDDNYVGKAVQIDEGGTILFTRETMSKGNRDLIKLFMTIRQDSMFHIICVPNFKDIDSYVKEHRVDMIIQVHSRGKYTAFIGDGIIAINNGMKKGKKIGQIPVPVGNFFSGYWTQHIPECFDLQEYKHKKAEHKRALSKSIRSSLGKAFKHEQEAFNTTDVATMLGVSRKSISHRIQRGSLKPDININNRHYFSKGYIDRLLGKNQEE